MTVATDISAPPQLRVARWEDYEQIHRLESSHGLGTPELDDWQGMWHDNPLWPRLKNDWPIGWVLENSQGQIVGSLLNVPTLYKFRGQDLICANGRGWVVESDYRGFALWLMDEYFNQPGADLFINTTVNARAVQTFSTICAKIPLGDWENASYWITSHRAFAQSALKRINVPLAGALSVPLGMGLWLRDLVVGKSLPRGSNSVKIESADGFDSRFDEFWNELVRQNPEKLLAARDSTTLNWHFAMPLRTNRVWIFTAIKNGSIRAYLVLKRQDGPHDMHRMWVADYQTIEPNDDLLMPLLRAALKRCSAEKIQLLENIGVGVPKMAEFDQFAPHRRKLLAWSFYYQASHSTFQTELSKPQVWDPSTYDGDATFE